MPNYLKIFLLYPLLIICFIPLSAFSTESQHFIDAQTETCIAKNQSLLAIKNCYKQAKNQWETELERVYLALTFQLKPKTKQRFRKAQQQWNKYKLIEFKAIDAIYHDIVGNGIKWQVFKTKARIAVIKQRVLVLTLYLEDFGLSSDRG
ncbi:MAG: DUF1311 domain-containing protein [Thiomargarita sp.]|nr:DUF1311 domain-containing protein [Thiomargarita sp.]